MQVMCNNGNNKFNNKYSYLTNIKRKRSLDDSTYNNESLDVLSTCRVSIDAKVYHTLPQKNMNYDKRNHDIK